MPSQTAASAAAERAEGAETGPGPLRTARGAGRRRARGRALARGPLLGRLDLARTPGSGARASASGLADGRTWTCSCSANPAGKTYGSPWHQRRPPSHQSHGSHGRVGASTGAAVHKAATDRRVRDPTSGSRPGRRGLTLRCPSEARHSVDHLHTHSEGITREVILKYRASAWPSSVPALDRALPSESHRPPAGDAPSGRSASASMPSAIQKERRGRSRLRQGQQSRPTGRGPSSRAGLNGDLLPSDRRASRTAQGRRLPAEVRRRRSVRPHAQLRQRGARKRPARLDASATPSATRVSRSSARCCGPTSTRQGDLTSVNGFARSRPQPLARQPRLSGRGRAPAPCAVVRARPARRTRTAAGRHERPPGRLHRRCRLPPRRSLQGSQGRQPTLAYAWR